MTLRDFLKLHRLGLTDTRMSILQKCKSTDYTLYVNGTAQYILMQSDVFKEYADLQVDYFTILGGGEYPIELCIYLKA